MPHLLLLGCLLPAPDRNPLAPPLFSEQGATRVVNLVIGSVLAGQIRPGMSREEVDRILGKPSFTACSGGVVMDGFVRYAIQIDWSRANQGGTVWNVFWNACRGNPFTVRKVRYVWGSWLVWGQR
jgi:hypothetical protein